MGITAQNYMVEYFRMVGQIAGLVQCTLLRAHAPALDWKSVLGYFKHVDSPLFIFKERRPLHLRAVLVGLDCPTRTGPR
jgi:hypothetical protein